jgi:hypothetical protein
MQVTETIESPNGRKVVIFKMMNEEPNPRLGMENRTTMFLLHRKYTMGDSHTFETAEALEEFALSVHDVVLAPVFMHELNGEIDLRIDPFRDEANSGMVGFCYITREEVESEFGEWTDESRELALLTLEEELDRYTAWLNDDIYGYNLYDEGGTVIDQNVGYHGADHEASGLYDDAGVEFDAFGRPRLVGFVQES